MKDSGALKKFEPRNYNGSLDDVKNEVHFKMKCGYEVDHDYVNHLNKDQDISKGISLFDDKHFAQIKSHIINKQSTKKEMNKYKFNPNKELKKFS